jgi:hypothetical protein
MAKQNKKDKASNNKQDPKKKKGRKKGQTKKKDSVVYYPVVINKPGEESKIEMSEAEMDYNDLLFAVQLETHAKKGLNNNQIMEAMGMSRDTFYKKVKSDPYFSYSLFKARHIAKGMIESAMFKSAVGFTFTEQHATPMGQVVDVKKYCTPNVSAQKEWLHNRYPDEWRKKIESVQGLGTDIGQISVTIRRREE